MKIINAIWNYLNNWIPKSNTIKETVLEDVILPILSSPGKYVFYCPGCDRHHVINTNPSLNKLSHTLSGTMNKPTIRASVLYIEAGKLNFIRCHSFVTAGKIKFLEDCTHGFAGKTVALTPL